MQSGPTDLGKEKKTPNDNEEAAARKITPSSYVLQPISSNVPQATSQTTTYGRKRRYDADKKPSDLFDDTLAEIRRKKRPRKERRVTFSNPLFSHIPDGNDLVVTQATKEPSHTMYAISRMFRQSLLRARRLARFFA